MQKYEEMAKLSLDDEERAFVQEQYDLLMESFKVLADIDTEGVKPLVTVLDVKTVLREDVVVKDIPREELLNLAPEQYGEFFQVPRTVEI